MHKAAIPSSSSSSSGRTWVSPEENSTGPGGGSQAPAEKSTGGVENESSGIQAKKLVLESAVIVFGRKGCFMCHVVRLLLVGLGVNPPIVEVEEGDVAGVIEELSDGGGGGDDDLQFPAVFVGGKLFGGLERVVATHVSGELVPILRQAGALWL
ncbi:glutaredoxin-C9-like [Impatiens glandulifera]|uniref:glutaredoxin-C9-like n=1 Tax=Impatiens glandulifera TaxID=253017 RepID=UPI001FB0B40B|nr:glutaredoxin-C9-like [Impatiens glandulifera]